LYLFDLSGKGCRRHRRDPRDRHDDGAPACLQAGASVYIRLAQSPRRATSRPASSPQYGTVISVPADVSREEECLRLAEEGRPFFEEGIHVLVNNAGHQLGCPPGGVPRPRLGQGSSTSTSRRPFYLTRGRSCRCSRRTAPPTTRARVINVGSNRRPARAVRVPDLLPTRASKAGLHQLNPGGWPARARAAAHHRQRRRPPARSSRR